MSDMIASLDEERALGEVKAQERKCLTMTSIHEISRSCESNYQNLETI